MPPFATISLPIPSFQTEEPSPLTPGSDTSTLFEFELDDPFKSSLDSGKDFELASPSDHLRNLWKSKALAAHAPSRLDTSGISSASKRC